MKFFAPMADILIPFVGLTLGAGINLKDVVKGGPQGILLGLITVFVGGFFTLFFDRLICNSRDMQHLQLRLRREILLRYQRRLC